MNAGKNSASHNNKICKMSYYRSANRKKQFVDAIEFSRRPHPFIILVGFSNAKNSTIADKFLIC